MKDRVFFSLVGVTSGVILGFMQVSIAVKIVTYIGLAIVLAGFTMMLEYYDKKLLELQK